ncbi:MAG: hypothetical protein DRM97_07945 [Thermoprotei archaeon]|nr:MAG: hypothetical protein DRM97_07945 [Thermoprotei archaeon]
MKLKILPKGLVLRVRRGERLLDSLHRHGIPLPAPCGGKGLCGKCLVKVVQGTLSEVTPIERKRLGGLLSMGWRLACQARVLDDAVIEILPLRAKILEWGFRVDMPLDPIIRHVRVKIPSASLMLHDLGQLNADLKNATVSLSSLRKISLLRENCREVDMVMDLEAREAIDVEEDKGAIYAISVDLGTTTVVASLLDIRKGTREAVLSAYNKQLRVGEDVISRIEYIMRKGDRGLIELRALLVDTVNNLIRSLLEIKNLAPRDIKAVAMAGNTVMSLIMLGVSPTSLGVAPFNSPIIGPYVVKARRLGIIAHEEAYSYLMPILGGYVGGDVAADIIASGIMGRECALLIDLGTNGELVLKKGEKLYVTSCAAGPAFEGVGISCGMRAEEGAIERLWIEEGQLRYFTIGNIPPRGLCGSALIDLLASLRRLGIIDSRGVIKSELPGVEFIDGEKCFVVIRGSVSGTGHDILLRQSDIRKLQLAKAAIRAACELLMRKAKVSAEDLEVLYVAGAFGTYMDPENAIDIGLIPRVDPSKVTFIGNGSLMGCELFLLSSKARELMKALIKRVRHLNLHLESEYTDLFIKMLKIEPLDVL